MVTGSGAIPRLDALVHGKSHFSQEVFTGFVQAISIKPVLGSCFARWLNYHLKDHREHFSRMSLLIENQIDHPSSQENIRMLRVGSFLLLSALLASPALAQGDAMLELYGEGVHRYYAGDMTGADQLLSRVVDAGSQDPRAHYFRGLVRERQYAGGGLMDFENGARLEAEGKTATQVGLALTRVQGSVRGKIEKARRDARALFLQQRLLMQQAQPTTPTQPPAPTETVPANPVNNDELFEMRSDDTTVDPAQPTAPEVDDTTSPFGDDPIGDTPADAAAEPAADSPFGDAPGMDAPAGDDNPFGDNPFGT